MDTAKRSYLIAKTVGWSAILAFTSMLGACGGDGGLIERVASATTEPSSTTSGTGSPSTTVIEETTTSPAAPITTMEDRSSEVRLAFIDYNEPGIHLMDVETGSIELVPGTESDGFAGWSEDRTSLAVWALDDTVWQLASTSLDGSEREPLAQLPQGFLPGSLSPDWTMVVGTSPGDFRLQVLDLTTKEVYVLVDDNTAFTPSWSPDGNRVAFASCSQRNCLWVVDADGTNPRMLVEVVEFDEKITGPAQWSPDGHTLLFEVGQQPEGPWDLWQVNVDGKPTAKSVSSTPDVSERFPSWSPDGLQIAFVSNTGPSVEPGPSIIEMMSIDGSQRVELVAGHEVYWR